MRDFLKAQARGNFFVDDWKPLPKRPPPPPVNDGPARLVEWVFVRICPDCGHWLAWRDQYLRLHCELCTPPEPGRWPMPDRPTKPADVNVEPMQLRLF